MVTVRTPVQERRERTGDAQDPSTSSQACYPLGVAGVRRRMQRTAPRSVGRPVPCLLRGVSRGVLSASDASPGA